MKGHELVHQFVPPELTRPQLGLHSIRSRISGMRRVGKVLEDVGVLVLLVLLVPAAILAIGLPLGALVRLAIAVAHRL
jgi:hypothetical protein